MAQEAYVVPVDPEAQPPVGAEAERCWLGILDGCQNLAEALARRRQQIAA
jgi:hypothetical protein